MQLFLVGDILEFRDKSQWEIIQLDFEETIQEFIYEIENIHTGEKQLEVESLLNRNGFVIKFSSKMEQNRRPLAKVYYMEDYRQKKIDKKYGGMK